MHGGGRQQGMGREWIDSWIAGFSSWVASEANFSRFRSSLRDCARLRNTNEKQLLIILMLKSAREPNELKWKEMIGRKSLNLAYVKLFVMDDLDEMVAKGFKDQLLDVCGSLSQTVQCNILTSSLPPDGIEVAGRAMRDPVRIVVNKDELALDTLKRVHQFYVMLERDEQKVAMLGYLCSLGGPDLQAIIYCNTRRKVDWLTEKMQGKDFTVSSMHGDLDQKERDTISAEFRAGASRVLVATDLFAKGLLLELQQVGLVIHYDVPANK
mmetsp:Transcript_7277/g.10278  ORF Transcript_7277/g.10278 Transcript_7277/m.10278 type:complete len:268 (+) Transcript_7277:396-1199(+)